MAGRLAAVGNSAVVIGTTGTACDTEHARGLNDRGRKFVPARIAASCRMIDTPRGRTAACESCRDRKDCLGKVWGVGRVAALIGNNAQLRSLLCKP